MTRSRAILLAGVAAALLANYWALEGVLAERTDPTGAWISDLGARSEAGGWRFDVLDALAGVSVCLFALALWRPLAHRSRTLRWALLALVAVGVCGVIDGAFPLSCAETLQPGCELAYDAVDVVHAAENVVAIAAVAAALLLFAVGLRAEPDLSRLGDLTAALAALWLLLTIPMAAGLALGGLDEVKGLLQRASQVVLAVWLLALAAGVARRT